MNPEDIGKILDEIGARIGPAGEFAWRTLVTQAWISGLLSTIAAAILILLAISTFVFAIRHYRKPGTYKDQDPYAIAILGGIPALIGGAFLGYSGIIGMVVPEYYAITKILESLP